jgi:hypothetical protein
MPFTVSPNIDVVGKNLKAFSTNANNVSAGFVGRFDWGPTTDNVVISSEGELYSTFGSPDAGATGGLDWWTAANFLSYGNAITCRRSIDYANAATRGVAHGFSAASAGATSTGAGQFEAHIDAVADIESLYSGKLANNLRVAIIGPKSFNHGPSASALGTTLGVFNPFNYGYIPSITAFADARGITSSASDELHIGIVSGKSDTALGNADEILEIYTGLSRFKNAKAVDGSNIYYKDYINNNSNYIRLNGELFTDTDQTISDVAEENESVTITDWAQVRTVGVTGWFNGITGNPGALGTNGYDAVTSGTGGVTGNVAVTFLSSATNSTAWYDGRSSSYTTAFADPEESDIDILIAGENDGVENVNDTNKKVAEIALDRKDCIAFISPTAPSATTFHVTNDSTPTTTVAGAKTAREDIGDNSYVVMDSGYKYMYDNRNDVGRWIPMNSDTAGLVARTTNTNDPWISPGGLNRGRINNVIKLSLNPTRKQRDELYASQINPITVFPGEGAVLYGDRTLQSRPSAFDRIHVRRLFNVLEKQIATAAKLQLFEFNDTFTQRSFVNLVEPFLRGVQAKNGIESFSVVCDSTNNDTNAVKDGVFKADIFVKPLNSINVVALNFTAQSNTAAFSENIASSRVSRNELSGY